MLHTINGFDWLLRLYKNLHFLLLGCSGGSRAAKIASSKTFFSPFCRDENI
jgi:hypothetical protein